METLYDKLTPETKQLLEQHAVDHPNTVEYITSKIKECSFAINVPYGVFEMLKGIEILEEVTPKQSLYDYFN